VGAPPHQQTVVPPSVVVAVKFGLLETMALVDLEASGGCGKARHPMFFFAILHASGKPWCGASGLVSDEYFYTLKSNTRMTNICTPKVVGISRRLSLHRIGSQESCQLGPCMGIINMRLMFLHSIQLSMYHHFL
jgi:hypothetical protein